MSSRDSWRTDLEAMAVRRLIRQANPEHLAALRENIHAMKSAPGAVSLADLDLDFHELLLRLAGHSRLLACWQSLRTQIKLLLVTNNLRNSRSLKSTTINHEELLRFIEAGDEAGAIAHLERSSLVHLMQARSE
jgi:DNA-binding GntR family transcriptional regulator